MTQEDLAAAVHVTRTTISSWERGRTCPNVEMLHLLSQVLNRNLLAVPESADESDDPPADETARQPKAAVPTVSQSALRKRRSGKRQLVIALCAAAVILLAAFAVMFITPGPIAVTAKRPPIIPRPAADHILLEEPELFTREWFQGGNQQTEGEPWLSLTTTLTVDTEHQSFPYWDYSLLIEETSGHRFTMDRVDEFVFLTDVGYDHQWYKVERLWTASSRNVWKLSGGRPVSDARGIGYIVYGYDEWGRKMSFRTYLKLSETESSKT